MVSDSCLSVLNVVKARETYIVLLLRPGTHTGGISVGLMTTAVYPRGADESVSASGENMQTKIVISGKATSEKIDKLFSLFNLMLTDARLDSKAKVIELLKESRSRLESSAQRSGHSVANTRMKARYRVGGYVDEITGGVSYLTTVKSLIKLAEDDWPALLNRLENLRKTILNGRTCRSGMLVDITGEKKVMDTIKPSLDSFLDTLPGDANGEKLTDFYQEIHPWVSEAKKRMAELSSDTSEGFIVPTQVSYVGKSGLLFKEGERVPGSAQVVSRFLRTGYLWDHVRVMGGRFLEPVCHFVSKPIAKTIFRSIRWILYLFPVLWLLFFLELPRSQSAQNVRRVRRRGRLSSLSGRHSGKRSGSIGHGYHWYYW